MKKSESTDKVEDTQSDIEDSKGRSFKVKLPDYEPRKQASDSLRVDPELPPGLQETRPDGL
jgi:hypothetical protein